MPIKTHLQSSHSDKVDLVQATHANPTAVPSQTRVAPWHEKLPALHKMGAVFGQSGGQQLQKLETFAESLSPADLPRVVEELQKLQRQNPTESGQELQLRLIRHWVESDASAAADWTTHMLVGSARREALAAIAGVWAKQNFSEAATWARQLSDGNERQSALTSVANEAVYTDTQEALELAATLPPAPKRDELITRATEVWASDAPEDALDWAKQIPDRALREQVISGIATTWGGSDPVAAGNLAISSLPAGKLQDKAVVAIVERWALTDQAAAEAWVAEFPKGSLYQSAQESIARAVKRGRPLAAEEVKEAHLDPAAQGFGGALSK